MFLLEIITFRKFQALVDFLYLDSAWYQSCLMRQQNF